MGRVAGKVALVTGAARGQGRSHAVRLAEEGADIIAVDLCRQIETVRYPMATPEDLAETVRLVEKSGGRVLAREADIRDLGRLEEIVAEGVGLFGGLDIVCANAGIGGIAPVWELSEAMWQDMFEVNLTGAWKTVKATVPTLIEQGRGGSIVLVSSVSGLVAEPNLAHYTAAKHGVNGLMKVLAQELAPHFIRVNSVNPCTVNTPMIQNETIKDLFNGGRHDATAADFERVAAEINALPLPWIEPVDVSNAVLHLACEESRYVTGIVHVVDAGAQSPVKVPGRALRQS